MSFVHKSVNPTDRIGADLIELRKRAGLTREQAGEVSKLTLGFIKILEEDKLDEVTDYAYTERQLKAYVRLLGGNPSYFLHKYRMCVGSENVCHTTQELLPRTKKVRSRDMVVGPRWMALGTFLTFLIFLGGYVYWQARGISSAPPLVIQEPQDGTRVDEPFVQVKGETIPEAAIVINGRTIPVDNNGHFEATINIPRGSTMLVVTAKRRYGDQRELTRRIIYDRPVPGIIETSSLIEPSLPEGEPIKKPL